MISADRRYFESMPCYLTVQNRDFHIVDANQRFVRDFGDHRGRYCYQIYKHRSEKCEVCPVERTFQDGEGHRSEEVVRCLSGREVSVIVYTAPLYDENGEITGVMEMSADITEVKRLQRQLRESQERYHELFENVPCYISIQDRDLNLVEVNRRFREDFGSYLGCKCFKIYKHREEECVECPVQQTFEDGQVHRSEEVVTSGSGEHLNVLVYTQPLFDAQGQIQSVIEMGTNITPIRQLQSQLESIGLLISSVSHGIKGLLNGLDGGVYLVNSGLQKGNQARVTQGWEMVQRNIERIRSMVLNILYYAKEREPNWEALDAAQVAREVCEVIQPRAAEHQVQILCESDAEAGTVEADPRALRSLLVNLLENSVDACRVDQKKDHHAVTFGVRGLPQEVQFSVTDNGIGMDRETREKVFSLFFSSKGAEGTGLGLFIAQKIAQAHGGRIEVESDPDIGTRFLVTLPRQRPEKRMPGAQS